MLIIVTATILVSSYVFHAQSNSASITPLSSEDARKANDEAQAEYYRAQTEKLRAKPASVSFFQKVSENPGSVLSVIGAFVAALVALLSFFFNYRATLRNQRDIQFYEALKRFGDKDSATVRFSAAGLIGELGTRPGRRKTHRGPYFHTALAQLSGGIQLEENPTVLTSIADASRRLAEIDPGAVITKVYETNLALEENLTINLAKYLQGLRKKSGHSDLTKNIVADSFWSEAIVVTRLPNDQLEVWRNAYKTTFYRTLLSAAHELGTSGVILKDYFLATEKALETSAERLRLNDSLFAFIYFGMFSRKASDATHQGHMKTILEDFLSQTAMRRRGNKAIPDQWLDLLRGRPSSRIP